MPGPSFVLLLGGFALASCHRHHDGEPDGSSLAAAPDAGKDRLAAGELVDGPQRAFELRLPAGIQVREAFASVVYAGGAIDPMKVANYLRAQVKGGSISVGAAATVFDQVTAAANPKRALRIRVDSVGQGRATLLEVRDVTPVPLPAASSTTERWRQVGLTPDGRLIDPAHLR